MRKLIVVLALLSVGAPALAAEPTQQITAKKAAEVPVQCQYQAQQTVLRGQPVKPMRLTEAPPARLEWAVNRTVNGCPVPVIVRYDVEKK